MSDAQSTWVRPLSACGRADLPVAGGKAAQLGALAAAGLPVPPGFVVLTHAYQAFVAAAGLDRELAELDPPAASAAITALLEAAPVPPAVEEAIREAYGQLGGGPVAVRSSSTAEDLPDASFAGQQETYLHVSGPDEVVAAVHRCWRSLWTERAIRYRSRQGFACGGHALAVIVQAMVPAEVAGVLFTADPVTGRRDHLCIDAAWGLGEAVVSGEVTPDHWVVDRRTGEVVSASIASKEAMTVAAGQGTATAQVPADLQRRPALTPAQIRELVELGARVEALFGPEQDIEWALSGGRLFLLQARPVTSLYPLPAPAPAPEAGLRVYVSFNTIQAMTEPLTPMAIDTFAGIARGLGRGLGWRGAPGETPPAFTQAGGRIFVDVTAGLAPRMQGITLGIVRSMDPASAEALSALLPRLSAASSPAAPGRRRPALPFLLEMALPALHSLVAPGSARRHELARADRLIRRLERHAAALTGVEQRLDWIERALAGEIPSLLNRLVSVIIPALKAQDDLVESSAVPALVHAVLRSLPHNPTTEMDLELWRLSQRFRARGEQPSAHDPEIQVFLARYGHRAVREIDVAIPRWSEQPEPVLAHLQRFLDSDGAINPSQQFEAGQRDAEEAARAFVAWADQQNGRQAARSMRRRLRLIRALAGVRECHKFYVVRALAVVRKVLLTVGEELTKTGRIDHPDDVFFLTLNQIRVESDLRPIVSEGRRQYERELTRRQPPRVMTSDGETYYGSPAAAVEGSGLAGAGASPGIHRGRVRIVQQAHGVDLDPGDVIVAHGTDPAWTPLFLVAGALVTEIGGRMSHGAVVAREYGIPAVVGVAGAVAALRDGQIVEVDGQTGRIELLS